MKNNRNNISALILGFAILLIIYGTYRGEVEEVLIKGINLCLECVGIG